MWMLCKVFSWVLRSINWRWILWNRYILYATYHVKICVCAECMLNKNRISIKLRVQSKIEYLFCFVNRLVHFTLTYLLPFGGFSLNEHSFGMEWLRFKVVLIYICYPIWMQSIRVLWFYNQTGSSSPFNSLTHPFDHTEFLIFEHSQSIYMPEKNREDFLNFCYLSTYTFFFHLL